MTPLPKFTISELELDRLQDYEGQIVLLVQEDGRMDVVGRRINKATKGALARFLASKGFEDLEAGKVMTLSYPTGLMARAVSLAKIDRNCTQGAARSCGVEIAKASVSERFVIACSKFKRISDLIEGMALRNYEYLDQKSDAAPKPFDVEVMGPDALEQQAEIETKLAVLDGVFFTRDLTNAPANVLTTSHFAEQLVALSDLGLEVEVLEEAELEKLGMRTLLCVGQGSDSPSKVVVMRWTGGGEEAPFALVGKGVVFDTGGISLKPAGGMEDMTMDMGGAGVVAGVMKALAQRDAKANVVGVVGLVENMPSGNAVRPGDVIKSMKGDTVEVINTDAEGRLVLADILWYTQERFAPSGMINLATLTGAIIIGLGHEMAGVFSNDDKLSKDSITAATAEGKGAWRMPLAPAYAKIPNSRFVDMNTVCNWGAGSFTACPLPHRFG